MFFTRRSQEHQQEAHELQEYRLWRRLLTKTRQLVGGLKGAASKRRDGLVVAPSPLVSSPTRVVPFRLPVISCMRRRVSESTNHNDDYNDETIPHHTTGKSVQWYPNIVSAIFPPDNTSFDRDSIAKEDLWWSRLDIHRNRTWNGGFNVIANTEEISTLVTKKNDTRATITCAASSTSNTRSEVVARTAADKYARSDFGKKQLLGENEVLVFRTAGTQESTLSASNAKTRSMASRLSMGDSRRDHHLPRALVAASGLRVT